MRECPARAVKIQNGQAVVMEDRCISCGHCVRVCSQGAKAVDNPSDLVFSMLLDKNKPVVAQLAPSFPTFFPGLEPPERLFGALRKLGFSAIYDTAFGADMVASEYNKLRKISSNPIITTPCPAIPFYIEKYMPELVQYLAPIVSPMVAMGRLIKERLAPSSNVVFIGPCVAKKSEAFEPQVAGSVDAVLTFAELRQMFAKLKLMLKMLRSRISMDQRVLGGHYSLLHQGFCRQPELILILKITMFWLPRVRQNIIIAIKFCEPGDRTEISGCSFL